MTDRSFEDQELEARVRAAEEWSELGNPSSTLPRFDLIALAILVVVVCVVAWVWGSPS